MRTSADHPDPGRGEPPVLVTGATGRTGRLIVDRLLERRIPVHALVRDPAKGATLPPGAQRFTGDVLRPETLAEPLANAGAVIVATCAGTELTNSAELVDFFGTRNLIEQATAAGVGLIVYVSSIYATRPDHYLDADPASLGWKARGEEVVRRSGLDYCIVRAGWLTDDRGGDRLELSQGDTAEGHLARADLADVCVRVLGLGQARGKTFEVIAAHGQDGADLEAAIAALPRDPVHLDARR